MPTGVYKRKPLSDKHKKNISNALKGKQPKNSLRWKGRNHPSFGKERSIETKLKLSKIHKRKGIRPPSRVGCKLSDEHKKKISEKLRGNKSYNWNGGQGIKRQIRDSFKYRKWRMDIFRRDNFTCQFCRVRGIFLEAHHNYNGFSDIVRNNKIKNIEQALNCKELWDIDNGVTLCKECHNLTKRK